MNDQKKQMIGLSTCWNYTPQEDIGRWISEIRAIGVEAIELDYRLSRQHLQELPRILAANGMTVLSVHNFCPVPDDEPSRRHVSNYYRLSAIDEDERRKAVEWTCRTVDTASRFGARAVVIHAGTIDSPDDRSANLFDLFLSKGRDSEMFIRERERILVYREEHKKLFLDALMKSLSEILDHADATGVMIGLETRYYPMEIPNLDEIDYFLDMFKGRHIGYWHDVGHAEINDRLGIAAHQDFLKRNCSRLIGMHIHDIRGRHDHLEPFSGSFDFTSLRPFLRPDLPMIVEARSGSLETMAQAFQKLRTLF